MDYREEFIKAFNINDKDRCVKIAMEGLNSGYFTVPVLYEEILLPLLYAIDDYGCDDVDRIWKEHVKSSIVKTVIESIYIFVIQEKRKVKPLGINVVLAAPEHEHHEIGLRMVSDYFNLNGYDTTFIGVHTPRDQVFNAIDNVNPKYIAISVTDYYVLFEAQKMIQKIKSIYADKIKIIVGGSAFKNNIDSISKIGGDIYMEKYSDFTKLRERDLNEIGF